MDVSVSSRHVEVSNALRETAEEKIGRLDRFVDGMDRAEVHFSELRNTRIAEREVCEVTIEGHGHHVRCKVQAADGYVAVDRAAEKLEAQLHKLKSKLKPRPARNGRPAAPVGPPADVKALDLGPNGDRAHDDGPRIVKSKRFATMELLPEEAAQRMELLGHGFFFFTNLDTHRAAVVYRRDDGDVGLIDEVD